jgi:hypothetical protein
MRLSLAAAHVDLCYRRSRRQPRTPRRPPPPPPRCPRPAPGPPRRRGRTQQQLTVPYHCCSRHGCSGRSIFAAGSCGCEAGCPPPLRYVTAGATPPRRGDADPRASAATLLLPSGDATHFPSLGGQYRFPSCCRAQSLLEARGCLSSGSRRLPRHQRGSGSGGGLFGGRSPAAAARAADGRAAFRGGPCRAAGNPHIPRPGAQRCRNSNNPGLCARAVCVSAGAHGGAPGGRTLWQEVLLRATEAAVHAPNHKLTEPWRFVCLGAESAEGLGRLVEAHIGGEKGAAKRLSWGRVPTWVVALVRGQEITPTHTDNAP